jgi:DNA-binding XRE family transcriptional regulator
MMLTVSTRKRVPAMNGKEYIQACKKKLNLDTDYKLALHLEISQSDMNFYARGERLPSVYACFKIGECLGIDPSIIMADIASETEKNPKKREFFKSFMSSCKMAVAVGLTIAVFWNSLTEERALSAS